MTTKAVNAIMELRKAQGVSRAVLAEKMGTSQQQLARLENGDRRLTVEWAQRAADALQVKLGDILGLSLNPAVPGLAAQEPLRMAPLIGEVSCGNWREAVEQPIGYVPSLDGGPHTFALRAVGDSMDKIVQDGGMVGVDPDQLDLLDGKAYIVRNDAGDTTAKRYKSNPARLVPASSNPSHKEIAIGRDGFAVIGRIVWALSSV